MLILKQYYLTQSHKAVSEYSKQILLVNCKLIYPRVCFFVLNEQTSVLSTQKSIKVYHNILDDLMSKSAITEESIGNDTNNKERGLTLIFQYLSDR